MTGVVEAEARVPVHFSATRKDVTGSLAKQFTEDPQQVRQIGGCASERGQARRPRSSKKRCWLSDTARLALRSQGPATRIPKEDRRVGLAYEWHLTRVAEKVPYSQASHTAFLALSEPRSVACLDPRPLLRTVTCIT